MGSKSDPFSHITRRLSVICELGSFPGGRNSPGPAVDRPEWLAPGDPPPSARLLRDRRPLGAPAPYGVTVTGVPG